jgi:hypothetical protein
MAVCDSRLQVKSCQEALVENLPAAKGGDKPPHERREQLPRGALAIVEGGGHRYSKNLRPAPTLAIHQPSPPRNSSNRTVTPFENLAAARFPLITMSCTTAPANDL